MQIATLKDIAEMTGFSMSTVSIVLSGKAEERNISYETQQKISDAAKSVGYVSSPSSRRLRGNRRDNKTVAVYWTMDYRAAWIYRLLLGIQQYIEENNSEIDIVVRMYNPGEIEKSATPEILANYSAAIICTAFSKDMEYLEAGDFSTPIILYNRDSEKYSTVSTDCYDIGREVADIFINKGKKMPAVMVSKDKTINIRKRMDGFFHRLAEVGMGCRMYETDGNTPSDGYDILEGSKKGDFDCLFCTIDSLVYGATKWLYDNDIAIPDDVSVISAGSDPTGVYSYTKVPLSMMEIQLQEAGYLCIKTAEELAKGILQEPVHLVIKHKYVARESCVE